MSTSAKYHHLVPQTYMSAWANSSGTLKIEYTNDLGNLVERNKEKIGGVTDFHSIKAGMPICTEDDASQIFASIAQYSVLCDGVSLKTASELNNHYIDFEKWQITRNDGSIVSKKELKHLIEQVKIKDIEENWSTQYENKWNSIVSQIQNAVLTSKDEYITAFEREFLMLFFTALDWRGFTSNEIFESTYKKIADLLPNDEIPVAERILPSIKTAADEMRHYLLLKWYRDFLSNSGVIYKDAMINLKHTNFHFMIADGTTKFLTCDSPAFICTRKDGMKMGLLPITPQILMVKGRCSDPNDFDKFYITHISDDDVKEYNKAIGNNATEFIIHPN